MKSLNQIILTLISILFSAQSYSQQSIDLNSTQPVLDITDKVQISSSDRNIQNFNNLIFTPQLQNKIQFSYSPNSLWIKFQLNNPTKELISKTLYFDSPLVGKIELYSSRYQMPLQVSGTGISLQQRAYPTRLGSFEISLGPMSSEVFYIKRTSHHNLATKIFLSDHNLMLEKESDLRAFLFLYFGGIVSLIFYNLFLGLFTFEKTFKHYAIFSASFALMAMSLENVIDTYLLPNSGLMFSNYLMTFSSLTLLAAINFVYHFLDIPKNYPKGIFGLKIISSLTSIPIIASFLTVYIPEISYVGYFIDFLILFSIIYFIYIGYKVFQKGYFLARFFLMSWFFLFTGVSVWFFSQFGWLGKNIFTANALLFANIGEMLILSLGLAYKINILDHEKRLALREAKDKERFHRLVKILSHDVANSLFTVSLSAKKIQKISKSALQSPDQISKFSEDCQASTDRIIKSIENLESVLSQVRMEEALKSFQQTAQLIPINLSEIANDLLHFNEEKLAEKNINLFINIPPKLTVLADKTALLNQVIGNVFSNSFKFTPKGKSISISAFEASNFVTIEIKDEGSGIPKDQIEKIFFTDQIISHQAIGHEKGTGLGSSIIREYMKIFNGQIEVESIHESTGQPSGTTVRLIFPKVNL